MWQWWRWACVSPCTLFIKPVSDNCLALSVSHSLSQLLLLLRLDWGDLCVWRFTQPLLPYQLLSVLTALLLILEQNKRHAVDAGTKKPFCWGWFFTLPSSSSLQNIVRRKCFLQQNFYQTQQVKSLPCLVTESAALLNFA